MKRSEFQKKYGIRPESLDSKAIEDEEEEEEIGKGVEASFPVARFRTETKPDNDISNYLEKTMEKPISRAAQIGIEGLSTPANIADLGLMLANFVLPKKYNVEPNLGQKTKEFLTEKAAELGMERPTESDERLNAIAGSLAGMAPTKLVGTGLKEVSKRIPSALKVIKKPIEKTGQFLETGSNITNPVDVAQHFGAAALPYAMDAESLPEHIVYGLGGSSLGGRIAKSSLKQLPKNKKIINAQQAIIDEALDKISNVSAFKKEGIDYMPADVYRNRSLDLLEAPFRGSGSMIQNKRKAIYDKINEKITPEYESPASKSNFGSRLEEMVVKAKDKKLGAFKTAFNKIHSDLVKKNINQKVPIKNVTHFLNEKLRNIGEDEEHILHFLSTKEGQFLQQLVNPKLKDLFKQKSIQNYEKVILNNKEVAINPKLLEILKSKDAKVNLMSEVRELNYPYIRDLMTDLGKASGDLESIGTKQQGAAKNILGLLLEDVEHSVGKQLKEKDVSAYNHMKQTFSDYRQFIKKQKKDFNRLTKYADRPEYITNSFVDSLIKSNGQQFELIKNVLTPNDNKFLKNNINRIIGNKGDNQFSPTLWLKRFESMNSDVKKSFYGNDLPTYENLAEIIKRMRETTKLENFSNTAIHLAKYGEIAGVVGIASALYNGDIDKAIDLTELVVAPTLVSAGLSSNAVAKTLERIRNSSNKRQLINNILFEGKGKGQTLNVFFKELAHSLEKNKK